MSPWHHIPKEKLSPAMRETLTILNRRWCIVWLMTLALGVWLPLYLNSKRVDQVQQERTYNIVRNCQETNQRRETAFRTLDSVLAQALATHPERETRIRESRASTRLLINALVPKQDCTELGRTRVSK